MAKKSKLLLADDLAEGGQSIARSKAVGKWVSLLADRLGLRMDLVHVEDVSWFTAPNSAQYRPLFDRYFSQKVGKLGKAARDRHVSGNTYYVKGSVVEKLIALAAPKNGYELLAMGTHGRKGLGRLLLGSVTEEVIRRAKIPVLTVGPNTRKPPAAQLPSRLKILVPTSLTKNSVAAEKYSVELARRLNAEIILFHAGNDFLVPMTELVYAAPISGYGLGDLARVLGQDIEVRLKHRAKILAKKGVKVTPRLYLTTLGAGRAVIQAVKKWDPTLVILGTHGRSAVEGAFFGRTARQVVIESSAPVLTIRSRQA